MADLERTIFEAVDAHWAVRALPARDRSRALQLAEQLWRAHTTRVADRSPDARGADADRTRGRNGSHVAADATSSADADGDLDDETLMSELATAYERAALERASSLVIVGDADESPRLRDEMAAASHHAFVLERVLPLPSPSDGFGAYRILKVASLAVISGGLRELDEWLGQLRTSSPPSDERWDATLRRELVDIWLALLRGPASARAERAFDLLGALREQRDAREDAFLASLPLTNAQAMRLHLFALYCVADAAATLTLHCRRGPFADTSERVSRQFLQARDAAAGDLALDDAIQWLALAAVQVAEHQTTQIEIPGLIA